LCFKLHRVGWFALIYLTFFVEMFEVFLFQFCSRHSFTAIQVITEKGVSDLAQHFLLKHNITVIRRLRKTDNLRVARACGATIVSRTDEITEADIGHGAGLFEVSLFRVVFSRLKID
jgi:chaperonin GroEL (HSP60 family)